MKKLFKLWLVVMALFLIFCRIIGSEPYPIETVLLHITAFIIICTTLLRV